jgi:hypothetical protein
VPECPNGLANLLQNLSFDSRNRNQEVAKQGMDRAVSRCVSTEATSLVATRRTTLDMICENSSRGMVGLSGRFSNFSEFGCTLQFLSGALLEGDAGQTSRNSRFRALRHRLWITNGRIDPGWRPSDGIRLSLRIKEEAMLSRSRLRPGFTVCVRAEDALPLKLLFPP